MDSTTIGIIIAVLVVGLIVYYSTQSKEKKEGKAGEIGVKKESEFPKEPPSSLEPPSSPGGTI